MQFYRIELAEQRRMMGVMEHHSRESGFVGAGSSAAEKGKVEPAPTASSSLSSGSGSGGEEDVKMLGAASDSSNSLSTNSSGSTKLSTDTADSSVSSGSGSGSEVAGPGKGKSSEGTGSTAGKHGPHEGKREKGAFPFSITAGVEKGSKNRYRNIWPFEHARVRLHRLNSGKLVPAAHTSASAPPAFSPTTTNEEKQRRAFTDPGKPTHRPQHKTRAQISADGSLAPPPSRADFDATIKAGEEDEETVDKTDYRKLDAPAEDADDETEPELEPEEYDNYINASYVQPLGTRRRYIATQGPLEATFGDFWTLVWQQNVHVVVMLTREVEGALIKCGAYWKSGTYGPLRVELLGCAAEGCRGECPHCSTQAGAEPESGGFFSSVQSHHPLPPPQSTIPTTPLSPRSGPLLPAQPKVPSGQLIKRTLRLTHAGYPSARPRKIVQLHYLGWPDMNVPNDATGVLGLVWEVGRVVEEVGREEVAPPVKKEDEGSSSGSDSEVDGETGVLKRSLHAGDAQAPVLLHCSAGVGRTGGFIAVDAVLNAVRQEAREMYGSGRTTRTASFGTAAAEPFARGGSSRAGWSESSEAPSVRVSPFPKQTQDEDDTMDVDIAVEDAVMTHDGRGLRTPMQVDGPESEMQLGSTTQRWAEDVADTKVVSAFTAASRPATSTPVSVGPSSISSAASLPSSGLGTPFQLQPPIPSMHRSTFSLNLPSAPSNLSIASISSPRPMSPEQQQKASSMPLSIRRGYVDHRMRTFSAPGAPALPIPAANSVPWLLPSNGTPSTSSQSGKVLLDRSLANSPLPRSVSPISSMEPSLAEGRRATDLGPIPQQYVDYKEPRALHGRNSVRPVRLSGFDDPIWEVVQDMREQRMSLCQSLRQYVFVHAAIIEGSLLVVDEERARAGITWRPSTFTTTPRRSGHRKTPRPPPPPSLLLSSGTSSTTNSTGKRQASPTELPKEDKKGEIALSKRLSIKRKQPSSDELTNIDRSPLATFPPP
ncbi:hypothetical protein R3P38DRAFT_57069 [Favolaschia claudopus]|uniref:Uncharacterized protein n=1 Tax=Favolaschia claudopus TaxID=2862362 RepID=A0AAW0EHC4_9AGAR